MAEVHEEEGRAQRAELAALRARVERFVPARSQLITHVSEVEAQGLDSIMRREEVVELAELRLRAAEKRAQLEQRKQERRELQATLDQARAANA